MSSSANTLVLITTKLDELIYSPRMKGYQQMNIKLANKLYIPDLPINMRVITMTSGVHDTHLMLLVFLDLKKYGIFTDNIKQLTLSQKVYKFI